MKKSMTFSELIYAINNRGRSIKENKALSKASKETEETSFAEDMKAPKKHK
jgi:hypothetical protein